LEGVRQSSKGWSAKCPAHEDRENSLTISAGDDGRILLHCFAGCPPDAVLRRLQLQLKDLFPSVDCRDGRGEGVGCPSRTVAHCQAPSGCTLAAYAAAKRLDVEFLRRLDIRDLSYLGRPAIAIPYLDADGAERAVRFRLALDGADRFRWRRGTR